jgi:prolyl 4-hydroxylase
LAFEWLQAMSILDEAGRLTAAGRQAEAVALVREAAEQNDAEALFALANWHLFGLFGPRDLSEAHRLFDRAAAAGYIEAVGTKAVLLANGTGVEADPAAAMRLLETIRMVDQHAALQLDFAARMLPLSDFPPSRAEVLCELPLVMRYSNLFTEQECTYLRGMAEPQLRPSYVTNPATGAQMPHPIRTSMGMSFGPTLEDLVVRRINERIAMATGTDVSCGEPLHILRYTPGQEYKPHTDSMPGEANQRVWTMLVYLSDDYEGGATTFPQTGLEFRGAVGDALIFCNIDATGRPEPASLHAGLPVTQGVKWLATRWIRARPYHPWAV